MHQTTAFNIINIVSNLTISCLRSSSGLHSQLFILLQQTLLIWAPKPQNTYFCENLGLPLSILIYSFYKNISIHTFKAVMYVSHYKRPLEFAKTSFLNTLQSKI